MIVKKKNLAIPHDESGRSRRRLFSFDPFGNNPIPLDTPDITHTHTHTHNYHE